MKTNYKIPQPPRLFLSSFVKSSGIVSHKRSNICFLIVLTCILSFTIPALGQTVGDFRSLNNGDWNIAANWQTYNGTTWVSALYYPGEIAGTYTITILAEHTISLPISGINTNAMGTLIINGTLFLYGGRVSSINFTLNTPEIIVTPGLTPYANIYFQYKCALILPPNAVLRVSTGGLVGDCNHNQKIMIGPNTYAYCQGAPGEIFTFRELMAGGGTISAAITPSATMFCLGSTVSLSGNCSGTVSSIPTYSWVSSGPEVLAFSPSATSNNTTVTPTIGGTYTISLTVTSIANGITLSNTKTTSIKAFKPSGYPKQVTPGVDSLLLGDTTTLTLYGGGKGDNETVKWFSSACGGTPIGLGNNLKVSPRINTDYYGRYENGWPCNQITPCAQANIIVKAPIILPISLIAFEGHCVGNKAQIEWTTASELNNNYFEIEQSSNASNWKPIAQIAGAGNSTIEINYNFIDESVADGAYFYRLKSVDYDGTTHSSKIIFLKSCKSNDAELKVYPNPSKGMVYFKFSGEMEKIVKNQIYNLIGELIYSSDGFVSQVDFSKQPEGSYYAVMQYGNKQLVEKFTIIK